eukprot:2914893-Lingulodinium_polyedra.AAC.1
MGQAKTGRAFKKDKPNLTWTRADEEVDHPIPPEGIVDDDTDVRTTSKHVQFLFCSLFDNA